MLFAAYGLIAAIISVFLIQFVITSTDIESFERDYLAREIALLEDSIVSSKGDVYVVYNLSDNLQKKFNIDIKDDCSVVVDKTDLDGNGVFYCGYSKDTKIEAFNEEKVEGLLIIKNENKIEFDEK